MDSCKKKKLDQKDQARVYWTKKTTVKWATKSRQRVFILTTVALNESNLFWSEMTVRKSYCVIV